MTPAIFPLEHAAVVAGCVIGAGLPAAWWWMRRRRADGPAAGQPAHHLTVDDLQAALAQVADWMFLCDAQGSIRHVLVADIDALEPGANDLLGRPLCSLLAMIGAEPQSVLPAPGREVAVTLADFGVGLRKIVPVRLAVMRTASADPDKALLAVATGRQAEVEYEDATRILAARMESLRQDSDALRRRILYLTEEEQVRIGRELHDGIGQQLAGIAFLARALADRLARGGGAGDGNKMLQRDGEWISQLAAKAMESCRNLSRELSSMQAHNGDLQAALAQLCRDAGAVYGADCALVEPERAARRLAKLPPAVASHAYRVAQEAVNNALRHGRARRVRVMLARTRKGFRLGVADDGSGFELRRFADGAHGGLGLSSMRVRATLLGGRLRIRARGRGTLVLLTAPLNRGEGDAA